MDKKAIKKSTVVGVAVIALLAIALLTTLAYLTSTTNTLDNQMTAGKLQVFLDEKNVDEYGKATSGRTARGDDPTQSVQQKYTLVPGHEYEKDPTVYVKNDSESAYVYFGVSNDLGNMEVASTATGGTIEGQLANNGWLKLEKAGAQQTKKINVTLADGTKKDVTYKIYYKEFTKLATPDPATETALATFTKFKIDSALTKDNLVNANVFTTAAATQKLDFTDALDAWENTHGK